MYNFSSIHSFVCEYTIRVGGLPVNYTSAEHDMRSTQKINLLEEGVMENNRTDNHEGLEHCLINLQQCWQDFNFENDKPFLLLMLWGERYYANGLILPKPSSNQYTIFKRNISTLLYIHLQNDSVLVLIHTILMGFE